MTDDDTYQIPRADTVQDLCISGVELKSKQTADCVNQITYLYAIGCLKDFTLLLPICIICVTVEI